MWFEYHFLISLLIFKGSKSYSVGKVCFMDGIDIALRYSGCKPVSNRIIHEDSRRRYEICSESCYFELDDTKSNHGKNYCIVRNFGIQFLVDGTPNAYHKEFCNRNYLKDTCNLKLICYKSHVKEKSDALHITLAIFGGIVLGISLTVIAGLIRKKKIWKHFNSRRKINNATNTLYSGNDSHAEEVLPCEENDIYNSINECTCAEPQKNTEEQEEQQRSCSGKRPYNHLFENEQKMCENYNEYEYPSDENYKDLKRFSSDSVKNIEAEKYFTLEKT